VAGFNMSLFTSDHTY